MTHNIIIGKPLVDPWQLLSTTQEEYENNDIRDTLFTDERDLPTLMVMSGMVKSKSEIRRNKPQLCIKLNDLDCIMIKWGKQRLYIVVGE